MKSQAAGEPAGCDHCGLPLSVQGDSYCCSGCFMAHHLLGRAEVQGGKPSDGMLARLVISAFLSMGVMVFSLSLYGIEGQELDESGAAMRGLFRMGAMGLAVPILFLLGLPLLDAVISMRRWLSSDAFILMGTGAALVISCWNTLTGAEAVYFETASMVLVLVATGRWLDARARERARDALVLLSEGADRVVVRLDGTQEQEVSEDALVVGDIVRVRVGEVIPVDGVVLSGRSFVDQAQLTGEEEPRSASTGDRVLAGSTCVDGSLSVRAQAVQGARMRDEIERVLAHSVGKRARIVQLSDQLVRYFAPLLAMLALGTVLWHWRLQGPARALQHGLTVVLIACPCALGLATPLAFWVALGAAWQRGILIQSGEVLERMARATRVFFDKTGTLTSGDLTLQDIQLHADLTEDRALQLAAALEQGSQHPIARALRKAWSAQQAQQPALETPRIEGFRAVPGLGVEGQLDGVKFTLMRSGLATGEEQRSAESVIDLESDGELLARFVLSAQVRPDAAPALSRLRRRHLQLVGLTGDAPGPAQALAQSLGIPVESEMMPTQKAARVQQGGASGSVFVGDGLNDAPALAAADVGIAVVGAAGKVLQTASVSLLKDDLNLLPELHELARRAVATARINLAWAFSYNLVGVGLAMTGRLTPLMAAIAMVLSSAAVVLNSCRLRDSSAHERAPVVHPELRMDSGRLVGQ